VQRLKGNPRKAICRGYRPLSICVAAVTLSLAVGLTGCAFSPDGTSSAFSTPTGSGKVENVHFYSQLTYHCGPASLAGVLNFYGDAVSANQIARAIFRDNIHGTVTLDMVLYVRERGFSARWYSGNINDIQCAVDIGYDREGVIVNSGKEAEKLMRWEKFLPLWQRAKCWALRVEPEVRE
jgi:hypothetical protein